jgi:hypothetical protein
VPHGLGCPRRGVGDGVHGSAAGVRDLLDALDRANWPASQMAWIVVAVSELVSIFIATFMMVLAGATRPRASIRVSMKGGRTARSGPRTGQAAPSTSREASSFQNFCDPFVGTPSGLTNDPLPSREIRTHCRHSGLLHCASVSFLHPQWVLPRQGTAGRRRT